LETKGNNFDYQVLKRLFHFVKPYRWQFNSLVFTIAFSAVLAPIIPYLISETINKHLLNGDLKGLITFSIWMLVVLFLQVVTSFITTYLSGWIGQTVIKDIRVTLYNHILRLQLKFFDRTPIGQLVTRNITDIEALADVFSQGVAAMVAEILQITVILGVMFYHNWQLTLISLSTLPFLLYSTYIFKEKVKYSYDSVRTAVGNLNTFVQEHIVGMSIVQIFNKEERELQKFKKINDDHRDANLRSVKYYSIYFPVAEVISAIGVGLLLWYGAYGLETGSVYNIGDLIAFIMYLNMFFRPIRLIADRFNTLQMGVISTARIIKLLDNEDFISNEGQLTDCLLKDKIVFENVSFSYKENDPVLKGIS